MIKQARTATRTCLSLCRTLDSDWTYMWSLWFNVWRVVVYARFAFPLFGRKRICKPLPKLELFWWNNSLKDLSLPLFSLCLARSLAQGITNFLSNNKLNELTVMKSIFYVCWPFLSSFSLLSLPSIFFLRLFSFGYAIYRVCYYFVSTSTFDLNLHLRPSHVNDFLWDFHFAPFVLRRFLNSPIMIFVFKHMLFFSSPHPFFIHPAPLSPTPLTHPFPDPSTSYPDHS